MLKRLSKSNRFIASSSLLFHLTLLKTLYIDQAVGEDGCLDTPFELNPGFKATLVQILNIIHSC